MTACIVFHLNPLLCSNVGILILVGRVRLAVGDACSSPVQVNDHMKILAFRCLKEDEVCRPSHGDAAVELVDLLLEELPELRPLGL